MTIPALAQVPVNVALGKPVQALTQTVGGVPGYVVNGDVTTVWWSFQGQTISTAECIVDLGDIHVLNQVVAKMQQADHYAVHASVNGEDWVLLAQGAATFPYMPSVIVDLLPAVDARYLRLLAGNSQLAFAGLVELEAYGYQPVFSDGFESGDVIHHGSAARAFAEL